MTIRFTITADRPFDHRVSLVGEIDGGLGPTFDLVLPVWVPGSYVVLDYARYLDGMTAVDPATGRALSVDRVEKSRWRVHSDGLSRVEVRYSVYAHQMLGEGMDLSTEHLFVNPSTSIPYVDGRKDEPYEVALHVPPDWRIYTELAALGGAPPRFRAATYDELVDSPIDCGRPVEIEFRASGVPHRVVLCGAGGNYEAHRLETDLQAIVEAQIRLFGGSPLKHYTFFVHLTDVPDGALEHATSNSAVVIRTSFRPRSDYLRFLTIQSHEYFHLYNVKRIHPSVLGPFDYTREVYTRLLWAMEGTTDYYGYLNLRRAGIVTPAKLLEMLAGEAHRYLGVPGRLHRSLEEGSFLAWIDLYKVMEETRNRSVSYYLKGLLVSMCLDLEIRARSGGQRSLDDVLRALWERFGRPGHGFAEEEMLPLVSEVAGFDAGPFFADYISGTKEIDFDAFARHAGLSFRAKPAKHEAEDDGEPGWLGIEYEERDGAVGITTVLDGGPGRRAGLSPGDLIIAVDGVRTTHAQFDKALLRAPAGSEMDLALFRRGFLTHLRVTTGAPPPEKHEFVPREDATPAQRAVYEAWLGAKWAPPGAAKDRDTAGAS